MNSDTSQTITRIADDSEMIDETIHHKFMRQALIIAQEAYDSQEVPVGCVFVLDGETIIGSGRNRTNETCNGTRHAELEAVDSILSTNKYTSDIFRRCTLYVTVEPCVMCAYALRQLEIKHVYYGCANERFGGTGGYYREESIMLLRKFFVRENENAPTPKKKINRVLKTEIKPIVSLIPPGCLNFCQTIKLCT
ncbi:555_t:CDS:2 [Gigaspora margarita]|uniref:555_t:CDS:1 n=1 Tax=Gigaspora margarita TaxID=4874 RepID=A0ABN7UVP9_GIGMA|nr:555_t:CDS:2 [Gigaspora margarita]